MKAIVKTSTAVLVALLVSCLQTGCNEQEQVEVQSKQDRLYASENIRLSKELTEVKQENERRQEQLSECIQERQRLKLQAEEGVRQQVQAMFSTLFQTFKNLTDENKRLKAELEQLKESSGKTG